MRWLWISILFLSCLAWGPRQFFDESISGLRLEDEEDLRHEGKQFLDDEPRSYDYYDPDPPEEPPTLTCEENDAV